MGVHEGGGVTWRALKPKGHATPCGCETDDDSLSEEHIEMSREQSAGDVGKHHHYPVGQSPKTWCQAHKAERPCECDTKKSSSTKSKTTQTVKGKKR